MTTGLLIALLVVAGAGLLLGLLLSIRSSTRRSAPPPRVTRAVSEDDRPTTRLVVAEPAAPSRPPVEAGRPEPRLPFARPGMRGALFHYGGDGPGAPSAAPFAIVDVETTGFSPRGGDRIVEIAIVRMDARGRVEDEYTTLVNPGRDVGPVFVHGISNIDIRDAPRFAEIAGDVLDRLGGAIVVAHNAVFEDRFLAAEFARAGIDVPVSPALCTLWLARQTMNTPNHKLRTIARYAGFSPADQHSALGDVRLVVGLLPEMLFAYGRSPRYPVAPPALPEVPAVAAPKPRVLEPRRNDNWLSSLLSRLPVGVAEGRDVDAQSYLDALTAALEDGMILGAEATALAALAGSAGLGAAQVTELHRRFLDALGELATADDIVTTVELRKLRTTAALLGLPDQFAGLRPTSPADLIARQRGIPAPAPRA